MAENPKAAMTNLTTKQKVIGLVTIVIFIFIIYEIIGLFSGGSSAPTPAPMPAVPKQPGKPAASGAQPMMTTTTTVQQGAPPPQVTPVSALTPPPAKDNDFLKIQQQQQQAYLDNINQLQLLKVKREIAETNQAIAAARLATETANKK